MQRLSKHVALSGSVKTLVSHQADIKPGILHIGIGAFHRAHQAIYTEDAMAKSGGNWGIVGVSLRSREIVDDLLAQDMLYSLTTRRAEGDSIRVVRSIVGACAAAIDPQAVLNHLSDPAIRIVGLTVTEKAYGLDAASGGLDTNHPAIAHDLQSPENPVGAIGYVVEGLSRRRSAGEKPFTVLCCDNLPSNGDVVKRLVLEMAGARDADLAEWINREGAFPNSMVDRIVPSATEETRNRATALLGVEDRLALETEDFIQWVIEDSFASGRPDWEAAGALFVEDVMPYEKMKLRLLNGAHSLIAYLGQLHGLEYVREVIAVPAHAARVRRHMQAAAKTLDPVPGIEIDCYIEQLLTRFASPAIAHRTAQIAMDGTQKLPQRIFAPTIDTLSAGGDISSFAYATALWLIFVLHQESLNDPRATELLDAAKVARQTDDPLLPFLDLPKLFPAALTDDQSWQIAVRDQMALIETELTH